LPRGLATALLAFVGGPETLHRISSRDRARRRDHAIPDRDLSQRWAGQDIHLPARLL